jgi:hypothetical protein
MQDVIKQHYHQIALGLQAIVQLLDGKWRRHYEAPEQTIKRIMASIAERIEDLRELLAA